MTASFPCYYHADLEVQDTRAVLTAPPRPEIIGGTPAEFDGRRDWWSPEGLLLASVSLRVETTYQAFARRQKVQVLSWSSRAEGILDKTSAGLAFTSIRVEVDLVVRAEDRERAERLVETAEQHCLISNSLKPKVTVVARVTTAAS